MITFYKKYYKTLFDLALIALTVYLIMFTFSYIYKIATPIILSFIIFWAIEPLSRFLNRRGFKKSIATALSILLFTLIIVGALVGIGIILTTQINTLSQKIPEYSAILQKQIELRADDLKMQFDALPDDFTDKAKDYLTMIANKGSDIAVMFFKWLFSMLTSFSTFVVNFVIAVILAYFLSIEIKTWEKLAKEKTPRTFKTAFHFLRENVIKGLVGYIKAQLKLVSVTFIVVLIVLLSLQVQNALTMAVLAGFFDILPLLGISTLFIPWVIYLFIVGQTTLAICLTVLLGLIILIRQILEPKITGDTLGVSAFTMLSFMIVSLSLFGISGLILSPVLIILLKALYEQGYLQSWIRVPEGEYDDPDEDSNTDSDIKK